MSAPLCQGHTQHDRACLPSRGSLAGAAKCCQPHWPVRTGVPALPSQFWNPAATHPVYVTDAKGEEMSDLRAEAQTNQL